MADARHTQQIIGYVFLGMMALMVILAVTTFEGTPTIALYITGVVFLVVAMFLLGGGSIGGDNAERASGQQQSVVLSGGRVVTQSSGGISHGCGACGANIPGNAKFCPQCGAGTA